MVVRAPSPVLLFLRLFGRSFSFIKVCMEIQDPLTTSAWLLIDPVTLSDDMPYGKLLCLTPFRANLACTCWEPRLYFSHMHAGRTGSIPSNWLADRHALAFSRLPHPADVQQPNVPSKTPSASFTSCLLKSPLDFDCAL